MASSLPIDCLFYIIQELDISPNMYSLVDYSASLNDRGVKSVVVIINRKALKFEFLGVSYYLLSFLFSGLVTSNLVWIVTYTWPISLDW